MMNKKVTEQKFKLSSNERLLLKKVASYYEDGLHKIGPNSNELSIVINQAPVTEDEMVGIIIAAYKHNLNIKKDDEYETKETLDDFIIASQFFIKIFKSQTSVGNFTKIIRELVALNNKDLTSKW